MEPEVGSILEGKVTTITKFGAFVALDGGKSGLVHISEVANSFVNDVHDFLQEGDTVKVKVLSTENGKINLSVKKALPQEERPAFRGNRPFQQRPASAAPRDGKPPVRFPRSGQPPLAVSGEQTFEDKLKQFMSSSEGRIADINRNRDGKRGGGKRRK